MILAGETNFLVSLYYSFWGGHGYCITICRNGNFVASAGNLTYR